MILFQPIVYITAALLSMSNLPGTDELAGHVVIEQGDALYGRIDPGAAVEKLSDNAHYLKVEHDGGRSYILMRYDDHRTWLTILECDGQGKLQRARTVRDPKLHEATAVMDACFLPDGRLFIYLHASPSLDVAVALGAKSGDQLILRGYGFTWDERGKHIAYLLDGPRTETGDDGPTGVWLDGKKVAEPGDDWKSLAWNATGSQLRVQFFGEKPELILPTSDFHVGSALRTAGTPSSAVVGE